MYKDLHKVLKGIDGNLLTLDEALKVALSYCSTDSPAQANRKKVQRFRLKAGTLGQNATERILKSAGFVIISPSIWKRKS